MRIDSAITVNTRPGRRRIGVMIQILDHHAYNNRVIIREADCACLRLLQKSVLVLAQAVTKAQTLNSPSQAALKKWDRGQMIAL